MRTWIGNGLIVVGLLAMAAVSGAWTVSVVQKGSEGPPNLIPAATESMTVRVHGVGGILSGVIEPTEVSATEAGNVLVHFDKASYKSPLAIDLAWDGEEFTSVALPELPGVIYNTGIDVEIRADGTYDVKVVTEQKKVYLGNGVYGYKGGNEMPRESMPFLCPDNRYLKPCQGTGPECALTCAP